MQSGEQSPPPTVMMNQARPTNPNVNNNFAEPVSPWQNSSPMQSPAPFQPPMQSPAPFQPMMQTPNYMSPTYSAGIDQNLAIVSLALGSGAILFSFCCGLLSFPLALGAIITGFMGMNNANQNPQKYGGKNLAIAGMVTGGVSLLISLGLILISFVLRQ